MLDALDRLDARATFFVVGSGIAAGGQALRRAVACGHELANHSWAHRDLSRAPAGTEADLRRASRELHTVAGAEPALFRAPYGRWSPALVRAARGAGLRSVGWDVDSRDWAGIGPTAIVENVLARARPGSIVLLHDGAGERGATVEALGRIVPVLHEEGIATVTASELLG